MTMQIVIVLSYKAVVRDSQWWKERLDRVECWNEQTEYETIIPIPPGGEIVMRAWCKS
ncbi:MAG: hypothetical protein IID30_08555 [Planctomycetes bacterium]|nr:hypothetical protein [Planctomycetota bacterium]